MVKYNRVLEGEKNPKSGTKWTREELKEVLKLYLKLEGKGIHENNPKIHYLSQKLNRTVRSTENQLLMFRSLDRHSDYGYKHMNKLCTELWINHIKLSINKNTL